MEDAERCFDEAIGLAANSTETQLATSLAMWSIGWLRRMDEQYGGGPIVPEKLQEARVHLERSLEISERNDDIFVATDRIALLGVVALLERRWEVAEELLGQAL